MSSHEDKSDDEVVVRRASPGGSGRCDDSTLRPGVPIRGREHGRQAETLVQVTESVSFSRFPGLTNFTKGRPVPDSVAVDAKRILLRYGAPINVLDNVSDEDRICLARAIAKTTLAERENRVRELLEEGGYAASEEDGSPS